MTLALRILALHGVSTFLPVAHAQDPPPPKGLHLSGEDATIHFGPNNECELGLDGGPPPKIVSSCPIEMPPPHPSAPPPLLPPPPNTPPPAPTAERAPASLFKTDTVADGSWTLSFSNAVYRPAFYMWAIYAGTYAQTDAITFEASCTWQRRQPNGGTGWSKGVNNDPVCGVTDGIIHIGILCYDEDLFEGLYYTMAATSAYPNKWGNRDSGDGNRQWGDSGVIAASASEFETISLRFTYPSGSGTGTLEGKYASQTSYTQLESNLARFDFTKDLGATFHQHDTAETFVLQEVTLGSGSMTGAQIGSSPEGGNWGS